MERTAKEQFLLNWDEGHDNPAHDGLPTKMEKDLEKVIRELLIDFFHWHNKRFPYHPLSDEFADYYLKNQV